MKIEEFFKSLPETQRVGIINNIAIKGKVSIPAVYRWVKGSACPMYLYKELIVEEIRNVTGLDISSEDLWTI